jgi:hypothetical protein
MKASLVFAIIVFIASLASFGSACGIIGALASAGWITYVLRRFDRAEVIEIEEVDRDV